ncbi:MAG: hypothetical protein ABW141_18830, partial [Candidatus Thiodiazotropha endolucinida]
AGTQTPTCCAVCCMHAHAGAREPSQARRVRLAAPQVKKMDMLLLKSWLGMRIPTDTTPKGGAIGHAEG